jgi:hypothetical protein
MDSQAAVLVAGSDDDKLRTRCRTRGATPEVVWLSPAVPEPVPSLLAGGVA